MRYSKKQTVIVAQLHNFIQLHTQHFKNPDLFIIVLIISSSHISHGQWQCRKATTKYWWYLPYSISLSKRTEYLKQNAILKINRVLKVFLPASLCFSFFFFCNTGNIFEKHMTHKADTLHSYITSPSMHLWWFHSRNDLMSILWIDNCFQN